MKQIILPTDFSDNSWRACTYAAQLFANEPCRFVLLHTFHVAQNYSEVGMVVNIESMQKEANESVLNLEKRFQELDHHEHSVIQSVAKFASLVDAIRELEDGQPRNTVIVMGTKGASGLSELFLGTMTSHVMKHAHAPLICVPENASMSLPKKIMLAVDQDGVDRKEEVEPLIDLAQQHESTIAVVNVPVDQDALFGDDLAEKFVIDHYLDEIPHDYHNLPGQYKEDVLTMFAQKNQMDLMVFIKRDRGFWSNLFHRSLTESMAYHCDKPMLILRS
jgi:nucleotide-binding universal stress UspA family protein